mmetsp:Transcript_43788/g.111907  ORF Transcript_43788/g.111907 Transcript_43788/m.111907 type:complete len:156 (-) Transcript_43788:72-539(-)
MVLAGQALHDAMAPTTYVCGMQPLDEDHHMYSTAFVCDNELNCDHAMESRFYSTGNKWRRTYGGDAEIDVEPVTCATCAGISEDPAGAFIDEQRSEVFKTLLPMCQRCVDNNEMYHARGYASMGKNKLKALDLPRRRTWTATSVRCAATISEQQQ